MTKTMEEINAEKKLKSRPDLIPAAVLQRFYKAYDPMRAGFKTFVSREAVDALLRFGAEGDLDGLFEAMAITARIRGTGHALAMGRVMAYGYNKHGVCTWRVAGTEQADPQTHYASALRHLLEYSADPLAVEEGSGLPVLDHALSQMAILANLVMDPPDRPGENDGRWRIAVEAPEPVVEVVQEPWELPSEWEWRPFMRADGSVCNIETDPAEVVQAVLRRNEGR